ncbi:minor capsid protein L2 [Oryctolagus cuniculus papillomavirus 1]|uniref:Minor capsid protein L2 n=1 Tax=Oryctolagus cuniculus papillomavirus 1 TaxID=2772507 RepID=Q9J025_9PAPI|nr:minor capsid protein L2 [Oryctolagus cuniculus papillomavirus 1]AAF67128.1 minor capsid protein L2 [Oryctolagus cuniculus papillomavirus 1]
MVLRTRKRRAAPQDIYPACKISNTCPPDIINKYENKTVADKILQYGSLGVYFGGLGIGTGTGSGGRGGYVPLGGSSGGRVVGGSAVRPPIPTDTVGPLEVIPEAVDPAGSSIVPLEEYPAEIPTTSGTNVIGEGGAQPPPSSGGGSAILDVISEESGVTSRTHFNNPTFEAPNTNNISVPDIVDPQPEDIVISYTDAPEPGELIELVPLHPRGRETFDIQEETSFITSTPDPASSQAARTANLASRRYQQIQVSDPLFLGQPRKLVQFENTFENPAFVDDDQLTLLFDQDLDNVLAAPDPQFTDVVKLSRPSYTRTASGRVRVSRLGTTGTIRTRSGLQIGPRKHFYYDISSIPSESIELQPIAESANEDTVSGLPDLDIINADETAFTEADLLDEPESVGEGLQLVISSTRRAPRILPMPKLFATDVHPGFFPDIHIDYNQPDVLPGFEEGTITPSFSFNNSGDFVLHPSLRRRRKRKFVF